MMDDDFDGEEGCDPQRMPKGGSHMPRQEKEAVEDQPMQKPASVKPGMGRNAYSKSRDAMTGFEGLESYKSAAKSDEGYRQGEYPAANKQSQPSIGSK